MKYEEQMQKIANEYMASGEEWPATKLQIARWAIAKDLWRPQPELLLAKCAEDLGQAMTGEHYLDPEGRSVRAKHAARVQLNGKTKWLWDDHRRMDRKHAAVAFSLRRSQVVGECKQLKNDVDSANDNRWPREPIQMSFNFTGDLADAAAAPNPSVAASSSGRARHSARPQIAAVRSSSRPAHDRP